MIEATILDHDSSSCFSFFFPSFPPLTWTSDAEEKSKLFFEITSQLWNDSLVAAPLEHRDAGSFRHPLCALRCTVHVCHPAIRHASGFKCVPRSRVLIHVNARYISTRCLHCAPVTKDIEIVSHHISTHIENERKKERWACGTKKRRKKKKEKNQQPTRNLSIDSCLQFRKKKKRVYDECEERKKLMIFIVDPTTVRIERRDGNGIVIDYTVHSGRRCDKFVLMTRQLSFPPVFAYSSDAICAV